VRKPKSPDKPVKRRSRTDWVIENIESILAAIVFALLIRAFIAEAFQIPTGSMATGFLGAHMNITCANCGHRYAWGVSNGGDTGQGSLCPLCHHRNMPRAGSRVARGDKILAFKHFNLYAPLKRYQIIIFKSPRDYRKNYIKRLIARGGEKVQLSRGDVFINGHIVPKPPKVQSIMWQPVYRSEHAKRRIPNSGRRWELSDGWTENPGALSFKGPGPSSIKLAGQIHDDYGYNDFDQSSESSFPRKDAYLVGDLRVEALIADVAPPAAPEGAALELGLEEDGVYYAVRLALGEGIPQRIESLELLRRDGPPGYSESESVLLATKVGKTAIGSRVALSNADNMLRAYVDGKCLLQSYIEDGADLEGPPEYTQSSNALLSSSKTEGDWIVLLPTSSGNPGGEIKFYNRATQTIYVPSGTVLAMGDNPPISSDSRVWGPVPRECLLGKAFCIWWPLNRIRITH